MSDFTTELKKLHELSGAEFSRQIERIALRKEFHPLDTDSVEFGYQVYILPNPNDTRTPDFILVKKGVYRPYDLKTVFGKASVGGSLLDSIGQCNRILINMTREYNTRRLAYAIKRYFEINEKAVEVLIFKGGKRISVKRPMVVGETFFPMFKKAYER